MPAARAGARCVDRRVELILNGRGGERPSTGPDALAHRPLYFFSTIHFPYSR